MNEINNNCDQLDSISDKPTDECHLSHNNPESINELETINTANTPTTITIAEIDTDDVPIRFRVCILVSQD